MAVAAATQGAAAPAPQSDSVAPEIRPLWEELVDLAGERPWSALQWTRGIYLGTRIFRFGAAGVPFMRGEFAGAADSDHAFLSGVYVTLCGAPADITSVRTELEQNRRKQVWLQKAFGDAAALSHTMEQGEAWRPALRYLPPVDGVRRLAMSCLQSSDPLVRRAGLYWGSWAADAPYWAAVRGRLKADPDNLTRRFAAFLLRKGEG
jgi:hypothetical protein